MSQLLWKPTSDQIEQSHMTHLSRELQQKYALSNTEYTTIHEWSVQHPELFWKEVWHDANVVQRTPYSEVMTSSGDMQQTKWFEGATLNFAENLLQHDDDQLAIIATDERERYRTLSYKELRQQVARCAEGLRQLDVGTGDRVVGIMPNCPEAVIAALAAASLGAIWSSCSPDFGVNGILDRFSQITPKVLLSVNGYHYNGKPHSCLDKVSSVLEQVTSIEAVVMVSFSEQALPSWPKLKSWEDFTDVGATTLQFEALPFNHPLYILYSSGTTGIPKSIVHGAGGTLLQHLKEHRYHCDLKPGDRLFYFTTCGWMMWNWLVSGLASGAAIVLYDGAPTKPDLGHLWRICEKYQVTHFGTSPKYLSVLQKADYSPQRDVDLRSLRALMSTGSPLSIDQFQWIYEHIKSDLHLASISGGTDIVSCFVLGNPNLPVHAGEIQCKGLGMDVHAYGDGGTSLREQKAELVCKTPFPSMPIYFWNDTDGHKYHKAYFDQFHGVWSHGDFIEITEHDGVIIHGRSDTTLNPGGVRVGTAEIYRPVENMEEVLDSVVIGQSYDNDVRVVLFVVLKPGVVLDEALQMKIKQTIRGAATPRHVPALIAQVPEIPRTLSGKKVEKAVQQVVEGHDVPNTSALLNPQALQAFKEVLTETA